MRFECSVCCETIKFDQNEVADICTIKCGHVFHGGCLRKWLKRSLSCPLCRTPTTNALIQKLLFTVASNDTSLTYHNDSLMMSDKDEIRMLKESLDIHCKALQTIRDLNAELLEANTKMAESVKTKEDEMVALRKELDVAKKKIKELEPCAKKSLHQRYVTSMNDEVSNILTRMRPQEPTGRVSVISLLSPESSANKRSAIKKATLIRPKVDTGLTEAQRVKAGIIPKLAALRK